MKHLLNNISEEEKNRIREQHTGGMKIAIDNFKKLVETKLGDAKPFINEANMETCEQCGNELTEGGECMECGSMYEEEMMEQTRLLLPDNLKINIRKLNGDTFFTIELDNKKVKADGDIVNVGGKDIDKDTEITVKYDCQKDKYRMFYGNGDNFDGMDITGMISDKAKEALKNIKTYCSGASAAL
jgi:hypothetical protein